ncbi:hypothetical protein B0T24DRAFT_670441 [Lasiosphaeria ovina]|uniref:Uncharacterized protein n=1 Tax=Lasiosphaeria ovina TaxID=92902 RepID=A0AAE0JV52_9PEZI|nr:hypothetical protein B0T24DRAFT_670441 [Lasiosphaeria ovina]
MATVGVPQSQPRPPDPPNPGGGGEPPDRPILPKETPNDQIPPDVLSSPEGRATRAASIAHAPPTRGSPIPAPDPTFGSRGTILIFSSSQGSPIPAPDPMFGSRGTRIVLWANSFKLNISLSSLYVYTVKAALFVAPKENPKATPKLYGTDPSSSIFDADRFFTRMGRDTLSNGNETAVGR